MIWKSEPASLAERKRRIVREELGEVALRLLAAQGFQDTTIEQIVAEAGVSRRTFFRYFRSKEDVILEFLGDLGAFVRGELAARPAEEPPLTALRAALGTAVAMIGEYPAKSVALTRLTLETPVLRGRYFDRQAELQSGLAADLAARSAAPDPLRLELTAAVALKAFDLTLAQWAAGDGASDLAADLDAVFELIPGLS